MQTPKEHTRREILQAAREEFIQLGFEKASMRTIAKKAKVSTSNIYNYFENKEHLLVEILGPILSGMEKAFQFISQPNYFEKRFNDSYENWKERFNIALDYVDANRDDFVLLLLKSQGSTLEDFPEKALTRFTKISFDQYQEFKAANANFRGEINEFVVRNILSFFLNIFVQMIRQNITKAEMLKYEDSFLKFLHYGYKGSIASDLN
ncbi:TetR/AcrR family transcriptional regulator [Leptospira ilyithenensis]|uniref:TetR family transcriptional regulator n=1 Tax=Leptospira ilyithenensis TaxID=2484901 RepID=A0A4V3JXE5_9LEPT|nr:TetR/AcrR family transcriptional regulator [Leptospira ilyithenensis]TGN10531.1 TetR family transcriptional regulator [Leptospira ilyithenensis]